MTKKGKIGNIFLSNTPGLIVDSELGDHVGAEYTGVS